MYDALFVEKKKSIIHAQHAVLLDHKKQRDIYLSSFIFLDQCNEIRTLLIAALPHRFDQEKLIQN